MMNFLIEACPRSLSTYGFIVYNHCMGIIQNFMACFYKRLWHLRLENMEIISFYFSKIHLMTSKYPCFAKFIYLFFARIVYIKGNEKGF
jgi:hypothetical protein